MEMSGSMVGGIFDRIGGAHPRELLANCTHDVVCNFGAFQQRVLGPKLSSDHAARLTDGADDAIENRVGTLDDRFQSLPGGRMLLQVLSLSSHLSINGQLERIGDETDMASQVGISP